MNKLKNLTNGIIQENPIFVMFLGTCPTLATTASLNSALGMAAAFILVLILTNVLISAVRKIVPDQIRIPVYIIIIATVVKVIELLMHAYALSIYQSLGVFLALIVVNCIVLGRAEAFAAKNNVIDSLLDAIGIGLGFALGLIVMAVIRELLGTGALVISSPMDASKVLFKIELFKDYAASFFTGGPGAFLTFGVLAGLFNALKMRKNKKAEVK